MNGDGDRPAVEALPLCERCWHPIHPDQGARWFEHSDQDPDEPSLLSFIHLDPVCPFPRAPSRGDAA